MNILDKFDKRYIIFEELGGPGHAFSQSWRKVSCPHAMNPSELIRELFMPKDSKVFRHPSEGWVYIVVGWWG